MTNEQVQLTFGQSTTIRSTVRRQRRQRRAHWWFQQMRRVVDLALDQDPAPTPRPEQIYFSLPRISRPAA